MFRNKYLFLSTFLLVAVSCKKHHTTYKTLTLQPTSNPTELHMYHIFNPSEDENDFNSPEIGAAAWTNNSYFSIMRALVKFDLSTVPQNAVIDSSRLTLYSNHTPINGDHVNANSGPDNTMLIRQVTSSWDKSTVTVLNMPSTDSINQIVIPAAPQGFLDLPNIDVTSMISKMIKSNSNYGFLLKLNSEVIYNSRIFCSSRYSDTSRHPKLVVSYHISD